MERSLRFSARELEPSSWKDFEQLMVKQGSCWCTSYQRPHSLSKEASIHNLDRRGFSDHNRRQKRELVERNQAHGIVVYDDDRPVGWCAYGPQEEFPRIDNGPLYRKLSLNNKDLKLWRIPCFYIDPKYRRKGVAQVALRAALASIRKQGGGTVEAYPRLSKTEGSGSLWFGTTGMFEREGFQQIAPLGVSVLVRKKLD